VREEVASIDSVVHGEVAAGFESVRDAFAGCFTDLGETGAAYAAIVGGRRVVDLWGGEGFERDSLVHVYSVTKPMAAFCVLVLADRGQLALDDPVARWWPEFAQSGKERVTVRQALSHQAGLVALREQQPAEALLNWERLCSLLAAEAPWWAPGTRHGEHALFYGHICGELVRRRDGRTLGTFWREEVAIPWGLDFHIGLGPGELRRAVDLEGELSPGDGLYRQALTNPPGPLELPVVNGDAWRAAEIPAVNGHGTAGAVARFYAGLLAGGELEGVRLVAPETVATMTRGELTAEDAVFGDRRTWGLGVRVDADGFGMAGLGGSIGTADPAVRLAQAYVTRHLAGHERAEAMDAAVRAAGSGSFRRPSAVYSVDDP
jgi:CubicO group peptidase (beta-lactamase class C family)